MTLKYIFLFFLILLLNLDLYSQENFFSYEKVKVDEISFIEKKYNSKVYTSKTDNIFGEKDGKLTNYGKVKIYSREENKLLDLVNVRYFYLENDSLVGRISYSWVNPKNAKLKDFSRMFDMMVKKISTDLNLAVGEQGKLTKIMDDTVNGIPIELTERRVSWKYGNAKIMVIMVWSEEHDASLRTSIDWE